MTPIEHKQYLIDSIAEMEAFNAKLTAKIETEQRNIGELALLAMCGIVDRKDKSIRKFKETLRTKYNHVIN